MVVVVQNKLEAQESAGKETRQKQNLKETQKKHEANGFLGKFYHLKIR